MADEIKVDVRLQCENENYKIDERPGQISIDQAAQGAAGGIISVGFAAEEDMSFGDVSTEGLCYMRNLDDTNFINYGPKDGTMTVFGKLKAGEACLFRLEPGVTITVQADTADCNLQYQMLED